MGSKNKNAPQAELGDFILFVRKNGVIKYSFIQAKNIKDNKKNRYYLNHKSFRANKRQQEIMDKVTPSIYIMNKGPLEFINKSLFDSITNYLVFYRTNDSSIEIDLSCVTSNVKPFNMNTKSNTITIRNKEVDTKYNANNNDLIFAKGFEDVMRAIHDFRVGDILNINIRNTIEPYLSKQICNCLNGDYIRNKILDNDIDIESKSKGLPAVFIDVSDVKDEYSSELLDSIFERILEILRRKIKKVDW